MRVATYLVDESLLPVLTRRNLYLFSLSNLLLPCEPERPLRLSEGLWVLAVNASEALNGVAQEGGDRVPVDRGELDRARLVLCEERVEIFEEEKLCLW